MEPTKSAIVYILSDSVGETGEAVVRAAISQYDCDHIFFRRRPYMMTTRQIEVAIADAKKEDALIVYTLVTENLRTFLQEKAREVNVKTVDIMGPMLSALDTATDLEPRREAGALRRMDDAYFSKIAAIEFAIKYDDGKEPRGFLLSDIVIVGISRTSKTPLCIYLAHRGYKVANLPIMPEINPPEEIFQVERKRIFGLTISPSHLYEIRKERLRSMGLSAKADYASYDRILSELEYGENLMRKIGCPIIDVTNKATEETAALILEMYEKRNGR